MATLSHWIRSSSRLKPALRPLYHFGFRMQLQLRCVIDDLLHFSYIRNHQIPPAMVRFRVGESVDLAEFVKVGKECAGLIQDQLRDIENAFAPGTKILDFGCGCGRVLTWLIKQAPSAVFYGADVDTTAIRWCVQNLKEAHFDITLSVPPLPYPDRYFDIVYCFSVFTHLDERMQDVWLEELKRILKPKGTLIFTVHGATAAQELDSNEREMLREIGFVCHHTKKLKGIVPTWYHTTWHTKDYIVERASKWFPRVEYRAIPHSGQDIVRCQF
jgi:ubiquinone/menaquinone biosynthesis C-methylase UbiE